MLTPTLEFYHFSETKTVELKKDKKIDFRSTPVTDVDLEKASRIAFRPLMRTLEPMILKFFEDPEKNRRFEEWKRKREEEAATV